MTKKRLMTEDETICSLNEKKPAAILCKHLAAGEDKPIGFNVPADMENDLEGWCDECEEVLKKAGDKWTKVASEFAGFRPICIGCFLAIKNRMR